MPAPAATAALKACCAAPLPESAADQDSALTFAPSSRSAKDPVTAPVRAVCSAARASSPTGRLSPRAAYTPVRAWTMLAACPALPPASPNAAETTSALAEALPSTPTAERYAASISPAEAPFLWAAAASASMAARYSPARWMSCSEPSRAPLKKPATLIFAQGVAQRGGRIRCFRQLAQSLFANIKVD